MEFSCWNTLENTGEHRLNTPTEHTVTELLLSSFLTVDSWVYDKTAWLSNKNNGIIWRPIGS